MLFTATKAKLFWWWDDVAKIKFLNFDSATVNCCFPAGESKGYGFIEYATKEVALQAKSVLDGYEIRDSVLVCDWLDPSHVTFASLHSTCLYVDRLPRNYRDMGEFRRIFSKVTNPPYCQVSLSYLAFIYCPEHLLQAHLHQCMFWQRVPCLKQYDFAEGLFLFNFETTSSSNTILHTKHFIVK